MRAAVSALGATDAIGDLRRVLRRERPDIVHLHNLFPLISARVVDLAHDHDAKVVQTVHNFRHVCVAGTYFRDGHECFDCRGLRFGRPGVEHACYRGSRAESLVMATAIATYRRQLQRVDAVIALAPHLLQHCVDYGFPRDRVEVIPNTTADPGEPTPLGSGLLFAARFSPEKGLSLLAEAWSRLPPHSAGRLTIVGDGQDRPIAVNLAAARQDVDYLGQRRTGGDPRPDPGDRGGRGAIAVAGGVPDDRGRVAGARPAGAGHRPRRTAVPGRPRRRLAGLAEPRCARGRDPPSGGWGSPRWRPVLDAGTSRRWRRTSC